MVIHIILNSHLDPVWLWNKDQGIDEVLATAYTACNILDDYPEVIMTRGEAWFYETIEKIDPVLFRRIQNHIRNGRWQPVGGWYVQPDCNLASPESYIRHGEIGKAYFKEKFGVDIKTGYNVDSFGHSAQLPAFYRACGMENYVMMRPDRNEKALPATDFIWRAGNGAEILVSRIIGAYLCGVDTIEKRIETVIEHADPALGHVMCFCGTGDHGGGPARAEVEWLLEHRSDYPGYEFRFSHPQAYFDAIRKTGADFPVVTGELQHHAVGSYSIVRRIKQEVRSAENALIQSGHLLPGNIREKMWKNVLFATFHDVLAGSCIASAFQGIYDALGEVRSVVAEAVSCDIRSRNVELPDSPRQRLIFDNLSDKPFQGIAEAEIWLGRAAEVYRNEGKQFFIFDEENQSVPFSVIPAESRIPLAGERCALYMKIPPRGRRIFYLVPEWELERLPLSEPSRPCHSDISVRHTASGKFSLSYKGVRFLEHFPECLVLKDVSDTWSHRMTRYAATPVRSFEPVKTWHRLFKGKFAEAWAAEWQDFRMNTVKAVCRTDASRPGVLLEFHVNWHGGQEMLKLSLKTAFAVKKRFDGCPGGEVSRPFDGQEYPLFNYTRLEGRNHSLAIVSPDVYALDMQPSGELRFTLLRANYHAYDDKFPAPAGNITGFTDQGESVFRMLLLPDAPPELVADEVHNFTAPVRFSETTRGIKLLPGETVKQKAVY